jgi:ribokinase
MKYDLIVIGSAVKDIFLVTDRGKIFKTPKDKLAPKWLGFELGEKIRVDEAFQRIGGVAIDISIGLKKLGFNSLSFSTIGKDTDGNWLLKELKKKGSRTEGIFIEKNRNTSFSIILVDKKSGERVILTQKSSGNLTLDSLSKFQARHLYVSSLKGKIKEQTKIILNHLDKNKSELIVSPSTSQIREGFSDLKKLLKVAQILILNRNEAIEITSNLKIKNFDTKNLFKILHNLGPKTICITDGAKGAWASDAKQILYSPIKKVKAVDSTGAGDAFASGFLGFYLKDAPLEASLKAGIINSASVVMHIGATMGLLEKKEIAKSIK